MPERVLCVKLGIGKLPVFDTWGVLMRRDSELADNEYITSDMLAERSLIMSRQLTDCASYRCSH